MGLRDIHEIFLLNFEWKRLSVVQIFDSYLLNPFDE